MITPGRARYEPNRAGMSESERLLIIADLLLVRCSVVATPDNLRTIINLMGRAYENAAEWA